MTKKYNPIPWRTKRKKLGMEAQKKIAKILNKYYGDLENLQEQETQEMEANNMHHHPITSLTDTYDFFDNDFRKFVLSEWRDHGEFFTEEGVEEIIAGNATFDLSTTTN